MTIPVINQIPMDTSKMSELDKYYFTLGYLESSHGKSFNAHVYVTYSELRKKYDPLQLFINFDLLKLSELTSHEKYFYLAILERSVYKTFNALTKRGSIKYFEWLARNPNGNFYDYMNIEVYNQDSNYICGFYGLKSYRDELHNDVFTHGDSYRLTMLEKWFRIKPNYNDTLTSRYEKVMEKYSESAKYFIDAKKYAVGYKPFLNLVNYISLRNITVGI